MHDQDQGAVQDGPVWTADEYRKLLKRAQQLVGDYGIGYQRGLRRLHYGPSYGDPREYAALARRKDELGRGYRDAIAGRQPESRIGRPETGGFGERKGMYTCRLPLSLIAKARILGADRVAELIKYARMPLPGSTDEPENGHQPDQATQPPTTT